MLRALAKRAIAGTAVTEVLLRYRARQHVTVLGYHRIMPPVGEDFSFNESVLSATPEEFLRELRYLRANLDVISMEEFIAALQRPSLMPPRPAMITFDDGYYDNHSYALPLLKEVNLPACFFVCTGLVGTRRIPWQEEYICCLKRSRNKHIESPFGDDDPPYELDAANVRASILRFRRHLRKIAWVEMPGYLARLRDATRVEPGDYIDTPLFMSWEQVHDLARCSMEIGGHTRTHPNLATVHDASTLRDEVQGCHEDLSRALGRAPSAFAYPFGMPQFMSESADVEIKRAGFKVVFSFVHGFAPRRIQKASRLPRIHVSYGDDHSMFRLRLATAPRAS